MRAAVSVAKQLDHEAIFLDRYHRLLKWACQLTRPHQELAEDLVQDAFIQFTATPSDLIAINNIDNYLFGVVRHTYLSHKRRDSRQAQEQLTDVESDSSKTPFLSVDPRRQLQINDELRAICQHACTRKDTSITSSILILRFFHGYVPNEVARLTHSSRNIVDVQLRFARAEAIASLEKPRFANREARNQSSRSVTRNRLSTAADLLTELRLEIFATRRGQCIDVQQLTKFYQSRKALPRATLSHLVSCQSCLDTANSLLGLPPLRDRHVIDVLGRTGVPEPKISYPILTLMLSLISALPLLPYLTSGMEFFEVLSLTPLG